MRMREQGISLVELMIAMLLGLTLIAGVGHSFLATNKTWTLQDELTRIQENARMALDILTNNIRTASYTGCPPQTELANLLHADSDSRLWMTHFDKGVTSIPVAEVSSHLDSNAISEAIVIHNVDRENGLSVIGHDLSDATVTLASRHNFTSGDVLALISRDCKQVSVFRAGADTQNSQVTHHSSSGGSLYNCTDQLKGSFNCHGSINGADTISHDSSELAPLGSRAFYLRESNGVPTLYRKVAGEYQSGNSVNAEALVEGIEKIQILYGVDSDSDGIANQYKTATSIDLFGNEWNKVVSVKLELLARSLIEIAPKSQTYFFAGQKVVPSDLYIRRNYMATIELRNRSQ